MPHPVDQCAGAETASIRGAPDPTTGWGEVHADGAVMRVGADSTVILPRGRDHQVFDTGPQPMEIVGVFGATPVATRLPDRSALELPWRS